ncbi:hypothetical protein WMY93_032157 [Mugilogobius chulae]|uniref:Ig-like domain-containing protein n=1 Tax=Mugilogobius chulae TaxID=88201 RepID=A0AAW0MEW2_9GOBI
MGKRENKRERQKVKEERERNEEREKRESAVVADVAERPSTEPQSRSRESTQDDAGEYRCEISAPLDSVNLGETNVTLKSAGFPPHTPSCEIPPPPSPAVVRLRCHDHRASLLPYSWYKDSQPISSPRHANDTYVLTLAPEKVLEFKSVSKDDSGRYSCLASNGIGTPKMCEAKNMTIEDVNVTAVVVAVLVIGLIVAICSCGGVLLHRNGFFSRHRGGKSFWITECHEASSQTLHRPDDISYTILDM